MVTGLRVGLLGRHSQCDFWVNAFIPPFAKTLGSQHFVISMQFGGKALPGNFTARKIQGVRRGRSAQPVWLLVAPPPDLPTARFSRFFHHGEVN